MLWKSLAVLLTMLVPMACSPRPSGHAAHDTADGMGQSRPCDRPRDYDIAFERFDETAQQIAHGTGCFIEVRDMDLVGALPSRPVRGRMSPREAVEVAIAGTPLFIAESTPNRLAVSRGH